jgi:hypothetical protein
VLKLFTFPSVQITLCVLAWFAVGYKFGAFGLVIASPGLGAAIARPIINLFSNLRQTTREKAWLPVHGNFYEFKDMRVYVVEDESHCRWVRWADVRRIVGGTAKDSAMAKVYPNGWQLVGAPPEPYIRDDALAAYLRKENRPVTLKMGLWVQRNLVLPSQRVRDKYGIQMESYAAEPTPAFAPTGPQAP